MYDIEASLDNDALLEITGALSTGSPDMNFQGQPHSISYSFHLCE